MDKDHMSDYFDMVTELRGAGIRAECYLGNPKNFGNQLKYADKREAPIAIIQGESERNAGRVLIKDLILGSKLAVQATLEEWKENPAQIEVDRSDLVQNIQAILKKYT